MPKMVIGLEHPVGECAEGCTPTDASRVGGLSRSRTLWIIGFARRHVGPAASCQDLVVQNTDERGRDAKGRLRSLCSLFV